MKKRTCLAFSLAVCAISACSINNDNESANGTDNSFIISAAYANRAEIEAGQLAISNSTTDSIKAYGQLMIDDYTATLDDLESIANNLNVNLPTTLDLDHEQMQEQLMLMSGHKFDSAYIQNQIHEHQNEISFFQMETAKGKAMPFKNYADKYLPRVRMHLQKADKIAVMLGDSTSNTGS